MSYNQFAWYYDSLMEPQFYQDYFRFILNQGNFRNALELGCGTGTMANLLSPYISHIDATDLSEEMIQIAREINVKKNISYSLMNMIDLDKDNLYDLVLCLCDSLNYVLGYEHQKMVLSKVFQSLENHGTFIFDVHSMHKINVIFLDYKEEQEDDDFYFYWSCKKTNDYEITHHVVIEDLDTDQRMEEKHIQQSFPLELYLKTLKDIGFSNIQCYSEFKDYDPNGDRIIFVCRKEV